MVRLMPDHVCDKKIMNEYFLFVFFIFIQVYIYTGYIEYRCHITRLYLADPITPLGNLVDVHTMYVVIVTPRFPRSSEVLNNLVGVTVE